MLKFITQVSPQRVAFVTGDVSFTYGWFSNFSRSNRDVLQKVRGRNIVVEGNREDLAKLLPVLHGEASSMLLIPGDIQAETAARFYEEANIDGKIKIEHHRLILSEYEQDINRAANNNGQDIHTRWLIPTSGTTGEPKLVEHSFRSLTRTTKRNHSIGKNVRWGLTYELTRFAGIQVFMQSILSGAVLLCPSSDADFDEQLHELATNGCNALSGTPSFWRRILGHEAINQMDLKYITLGGEIADQQILNQLKNKFPKAKIIHIYASTEAGVCFSVKDGLEGFPASYLEKEVNGNQIKIGDDRILYVKPGYADQRYIGNNDLFEEDGFINTGDLVIQTTGRVRFLGRSSASIKVGNHKVIPEEIEQCILASGMVKEAYVYGMKSPAMGEIVKVEVVINDDNDDRKNLKKAILEYCKEKLDSYKVPAIIKQVDEILLNETAKHVRKIKGSPYVK
ncbi:MAG: acyl--CoA ligase [Balneolaceae bacterium]|nr:acyl--CoA ligase [Balneolaceae bacterium]